MAPETFDGRADDQRAPNSVHFNREPVLWAQKTQGPTPLISAKRHRHLLNGLMPHHGNARLIQLEQKAGYYTIIVFRDIIISLSSVKNSISITINYYIFVINYHIIYHKGEISL